MMALLLFFFAINTSTTIVARTSYLPQWSPGGNEIVFYSQIDERWRILKVDIDGSNLTLLSHGNHNDFYPSFSPSGDRVLFYSDRDGNQEIYSMNPDGSEVRRLTRNSDPDRHPKWSPDGTKIAYVCKNSKGNAICVMNADGSSATRVTDPEHWTVVSRLAWSRDGTHILFYASNDRKEMHGENKWALFSVSLAKRSVQQLDTIWKRDSNPSSSPKTGKLAVDAHREGSWESEDGGWEIFETHQDGTERRNLTNNNRRNDWAPSWSSDGTKIAYSSGLNDQYEIFVMNADGTEVRQITNLIRDADLFVDSRDMQIYPTAKIGKQVWFASNLNFSARASWCYNDTRNCDATGRLYTWESARNSCPAGWHLPAEDEWGALEMHLGMKSEEVSKIGPRGTDEGFKLGSSGKSGFNALIAGYRRPNGEYVRQAERSAFWLATEANNENAWHRDVRSNTGSIYRSEVTKTYALSVRCVKNR